MLERKLFIGGREVSGNAGPRVVVNPFSMDPVGSVDYADRSQMEDAIHIASECFRTFRKSAAYERSAILSDCSTRLQGRKEEIAQLICSESGKPINYARGEVERAIFTFASAAEEAHHAGEGRVLEMSVAKNGEGRTGRYRYFPLGPIAAITPFNFPLNLVAHKVAPAIAAGNTVVLKPAPQTPLTSFVLADLLYESGLPRQALSVVPCENDVAETLVSNPAIKLVSFTGSAAVGWKIKSLAQKARVVLELGGNGCVILDEVGKAGDTASIDSVISTLTHAAFNYAGQICISLQTLYIKRGSYEDVLSRMIEQAKKVVVGNPADEGTLVGPMISADAMRKVESWIAEAIAGGAVRHTGELREPNWITPTVLSNVPRSSTLYREEAFAPLVIIEPYDDLDSLLTILNQNKYGLQAGLFSSDVNVIEKVYAELEVGALIVNDVNGYRLDTMPYGGVKESGLGREGLRYAMRDMSEMKLMVTKLHL